MGQRNILLIEFSAHNRLFLNDFLNSAVLMFIVLGNAEIFRPFLILNHTTSFEVSKSLVLKLTSALTAVNKPETSSADATNSCQSVYTAMLATRSVES